MITKRTLAEQSLKLLVGGKISPDSGVSIQQLVLCVQQAFASVARLNFFENKNEGESLVDGSFIYTFPKEDVLKDCDTNMYYCVMPSTTITLPNEMGLYFVGLRKEQSRPWVRLPNGYTGLMSGLAVETMEGNKTFFQEGKRLYFPNVTDNDGIKNIMLKLVVGFDNIDDDEEINIPKDLQLQIVTMAVQLYQKEAVTPSDKTPDMV